MRIIDITLANLPGNPTPRQLVAFWCEWILGWVPPGGWVGGFGTHWSQAPTTLGQAALRFFTQDFDPGVIDAQDPFPADSAIPRASIETESWPHYWNQRLRGLVALILWSPQFMQR